MGKQLNYYMDYDSFLIVAQAALDSGYYDENGERVPRDERIL